MFFSVLCLLCLCTRLFIYAVVSPAAKGPFGSRLWCLTVSLLLSYWYPGLGWYLIVSIPDLCTLTCFKKKCN